MKTLTPEDRTRITREIHDVLDRLIRGCETLDMDLAFGMFDRSDAFRMVAGDGTLCTFAEYYANNVAYLSQCKSFMLDTIGTNVLVLRDDLAVLTWSYRVAATLESGSRHRIDRAGATFVLQKEDEQWRVIRYHESSSPLQETGT